MLSLRDGNAIETLLMTAQINTDLVNHPVPLTTEPSIILLRVETDACKSIINSILRYKDNDFHKNAHEYFRKQFIDNRSIYDRLWFRDDLRTMSCAAEHFHRDASLEAVDNRAANNSKNWQWTTKDDARTGRLTPASHDGE
ncbi:uncharacterized protein TNCV_3696381 [Trichonephila clavipes]|nr:uncharacterized protein TNCV_3696381 [Trichonephila clavipes]